MSYLIGVVILLGALIFIHELGHFLVAKACGVRVEIFSIGIGKKVLSFTRGETEYVLSLFPLGGYVKLTGQDPREEISEDLQLASFRHKPLWKRAAIVFAGPFFNIVLTIFIFLCLYLSKGLSVQAPTLTRVLKESPAFQSGFRSGDTILSINGQKVEEWQELQSWIKNSVGKTLNFKVLRKGESLPLLFSHRPTLGLSRNPIIGVLEEGGVIEGVEHQRRGPSIYIREGSWAAKRGLPSLLWVEKILVFEDPSSIDKDSSSKKVFEIYSYEDLKEAWENLTSKEEGTVVLEGRPLSLPKSPLLSNNEDSESPDDASPEEKEKQRFHLSWIEAKDALPQPLQKSGIVSSELVVSQIKEGSPAESLGLRPYDEILYLNHKKVQSFYDFKKRLQKLAVTQKPLSLTWLRSNQEMEVKFQPKEVETQDPLTQAALKEYQIGAAFLALPVPAERIRRKASNIFHAMMLSCEKTYLLTKSMILSFYYLITNKISHKTLGGPILVGKIAGESVQRGWEAFVKMMAFISLNLAVLNLLPIPILDGGHLLLFFIEAIRRKPLSLKVVEIWTTTGFFFLIGLAILVFFNDIDRVFF